eukprot:gene35357-biopygen30085
MTKLYYTSTSCGAASFIAAFTAGLTIEAEQVNIGTHVTASGADFYAINPKGNVPALILDDGTILNENTAILQYIADLAPGKIAPLNGTTERSVLQNVLSYVSTEVHPSIGGLFNPAASEEVKTYIKGNAAKKLAYLESTIIGDKQFVVGDSFTVADSYLYIVLSWTAYVGIDLAPYPKVQAYSQRIGALENVVAAHARIATSPTTTL